MSHETIEYHQDFCAWLSHNIELLRQGNFAKLDVTNIIEELEGLGISQHHALENRLIILLMHLLKWGFQPERRSKSWKSTLREQRYRIQQLLKSSPSLKPKLGEVITEVYPKAIGLAADETGKPKSLFPEKCPFTLEQILDEEFLPKEYPT